MNIKRFLIILNLLLLIAIFWIIFHTIHSHSETEKIIKKANESILIISKQKNTQTPDNTTNTTNQEETIQSPFLKLISTKHIFGTPPKPALQAILGPLALIDGYWHILNEKHLKTNLILLHLDQTSVIVQDEHSTMTLEMFIQHSPAIGSKIAKEKSNSDEKKRSNPIKRNTNRKWTD